MFSKKKTFFSVLFGGLCLLTACSMDDAQTVYSKMRAYFYYDKVLTNPPLYTALTGMGDYCTIAARGAQIVSKSLSSSHSDNITAISAYSKFVCVNGFIVGRSNMPDMTTGEIPTLCFDLVCPNCYASNSVARDLELRENGRAYCPICHREYDLNNGGLIVGGENGKKLIRYRVSYDSRGILLVNN